MWPWEKMMLINNIPPGLALIAPAVPVSPSDNDDAIPCISTDAANKCVPYSAYSHGGTTTAKMGPAAAAASGTSKKPVQANHSNTTGT